MSIRAANNAALTGMQASTAGVAVASTNIANADVDGYTAKTVSLTTTTSSGVASGVSATLSGASIDSQLVASILDATSSTAAAKVITTSLSRVDTALGTPGDDGALTTEIANLETALLALAESADESANVSEALAEAESLTTELNSLSSTIQDERTSAEDGIATTVDAINASLEALESYNSQIAEAEARGESTADLEDLRTTELENLSSLMDVEYFTNSANQLQIYTSGGDALLTSEAQTLSFSAAGSVNSNMSYPDTLNGIMLNGEDITEDISGGALGGYIELRDETLPAFQDELDALATALIDELNAISNSSTAAPPPASLSSTDTVSGTDSFDGTGTVQLILTDSDGTATEVLDLDLSTYATVQDLVDDINSMSGVSASIGSDGLLTISADDSSNGIALNSLDDSVAPDGDSLSAAFGFNDLLTGTGANDIAVNQVVLDDTSRFPTGSLDDASSISVGDVVVASGDGSAATALAEALTADRDFDSAGNLGSGSLSIESYAGQIMSDIALVTETAEDTYELEYDTQQDLKTSFSNSYGVNLDEEAAKLTELENAYSASAAVMTVTQAMFDALQGIVN